MRAIKFPKDSNSFSLLWQWLRFAALCFAVLAFTFCYIKAHAHVVDIEIDLHGYIDRLWKEVDQERNNPEITLQEILSKNCKEKEKKERE